MLKSCNPTAILWIKELALFLFWASLSKGLMPAPVRASRCDISGLAAEWEGVATILGRMKNGHDLLRECSDKQVDIKTPATYSDVLKPILARMMLTRKAKLPSIDDLREQVEMFLQGAKRDPDVAQVDKLAWLIRKNLGFIKLKVRRLEVSVASQLKLNMASGTQHVVTVPQTVYPDTSNTRNSKFPHSGSCFPGPLHHPRSELAGLDLIANLVLFKWFNVAWVLGYQGPGIIRPTPV